MARRPLDRTICRHCGREVAYRRTGFRRLDDGRQQPVGCPVRHQNAHVSDLVCGQGNQDVGDAIDAPPFGSVAR